MRWQQCLRLRRPRRLEDYWRIVCTAFALSLALYVGRSYIWPPLVRNGRVCSGARSPDSADVQVVVVSTLDPRACLDGPCAADLVSSIASLTESASHTRRTLAIDVALVSNAGRLAVATESQVEVDTCAARHVRPLPLRDKVETPAAIEAIATHGYSLAVVFFEPSVYRERGYELFPLLKALRGRVPSLAVLSHVPAPVDRVGWRAVSMLVEMSDAVAVFFPSDRDALEANYGVDVARVVVLAPSFAVPSFKRESEDSAETKGEAERCLVAYGGENALSAEEMVVALGALGGKVERASAFVVGVVTQVADRIRAGVREMDGKGATLTVTVLDEANGFEGPRLSIDKLLASCPVLVVASRSRAAAAVAFRALHHGRRVVAAHGHASVHELLEVIGDSPPSGARGRRDEWSDVVAESITRGVNDAAAAKFTRRPLWRENIARMVSLLCKASPTHFPSSDLPASCELSRAFATSEAWGKEVGVRERKRARAPGSRAHHGGELLVGAGLVRAFDGRVLDFPSMAPESVFNVFAVPDVTVGATVYGAATDLKRHAPKVASLFAGDSFYDPSLGWDIRAQSQRPLREGDTLASQMTNVGDVLAAVVVTQWGRADDAISIDGIAGAVRVGDRLLTAGQYYRLRSPSSPRRVLKVLVWRTTPCINVRIVHWSFTLDVRGWAAPGHTRQGLMLRFTHHTPALQPEGLFGSLAHVPCGGVESECARIDTENAYASRAGDDYGLSGATHLTSIATSAADNMRLLASSMAEKALPLMLGWSAKELVVLRESALPRTVGHGLIRSNVERAADALRVRWSGPALADSASQHQQAAGAADSTDLTHEDWAASDRLLAVAQSHPGIDVVSVEGVRAAELPRASHAPCVRTDAFEFARTLLSPLRLNASEEEADVTLVNAAHVAYDSDDDALRYKAGGGIVFALAHAPFSIVPNSQTKRLSSAARVVVPSRAAAAAFKRAGISETRIRVVPVGVGSYVPCLSQGDGVCVDASTLTAGEPSMARANKLRAHFVFVGDGRDRHALDVVLRAYADEFTMEERVLLDVHVVSGTVPENVRVQLEKMQSNEASPWLRLSSYVGTPGAGVANASVASALARAIAGAHAVVVPYRADDRGLVALDAIALGIPVIAVGNGVLADATSGLQKSEGILDVERTPCSQPGCDSVLPKATLQDSDVRKFSWAHVDSARVRPLMRAIADDLSGPKGEADAMRSSLYAAGRLLPWARVFDAIVEEMRTACAESTGC